MMQSLQGEQHKFIAKTPDDSGVMTTFQHVSQQHKMYGLLSIVIVFEIYYFSLQKTCVFFGTNILESTDFGLISIDTKSTG